MPQSLSVREELVKCIERFTREKGERPAVIRMSLTKYLRLGAELGRCLKRVGVTKIEFFLTESEKREAARAE